MTIRLIQLLCPSRHCIIAALYEADDAGAEGARQIEHLEAFLAHGAINRHCGICGSTSLRYEDRITRFKTLEEALAAGKDLEHEQMRDRATLDGMGLTFDAKQKGGRPESQPPSGSV
jgi:hypothetical protein